jgi:hypothetical protein
MRVILALSCILGNLSFFGIKDIALHFISFHFKQNHYTFRHLKYAYPSSDMRDVTTRVTLFCILNNSQAILMLNPIFYYCLF